MSKLEAIKETITHLFSGPYSEMYCERCHQITEHNVETAIVSFGNVNMPHIYRCRVCGMGRQSW